MLISTGLLKCGSNQRRQFIKKYLAKDLAKTEGGLNGRETQM